MEYFYFGAGGGVEPLDHAGYFDLTAHDLGSKLRKQTVLRLEAWASRSSTRSTRTDRASTRSTCATPTR